jgi:hypothetical protein
MTTLTHEEHVELLAWYIDLVGSCEGVDFLGPTIPPEDDADELSNEQWAVLREVANKHRREDSQIK